MPYGHSSPQNSFQAFLNLSQNSAKWLFFMLYSRITNYFFNHVVTTWLYRAPLAVPPSVPVKHAKDVYTCMGCPGYASASTATVPGLSDATCARGMAGWR
jgi:hypothetical protein